MIFEQYIEKETAILAKAKGFDEECTYLWGVVHGHDGEGYEGRHKWDNVNHLCNEKQFSAPRQEEVQKWLREIHKIHVEPMYDCNQNIYNCHFVVYYKGENNSPRWEEYTRFYHVNSYEQALEMGLKEALALIKIT